MNTMMSNSTNFSSYADIMKDLYNMHSSPLPFMSRQTFQKWFLAWASHMDVDYRIGCTGCKTQVEFLGCDGTKIGELLIYLL